MRDQSFAVLRPGDRFHERYHLVRCIKSGGMGAVYEVTDERTSGRRALKVMLPDIVGDARMRARFAQEAQITGSIESEHLVQISDAGVDAETEMPFLVMEMLRGEDLGALIARQGPLDPRDVVAYLYQAALALEKTHAVGVIHRDLKPENLFLTRRDDGSPCLKILDFGIAKLTLAAATRGLTTKVIGTPLYMSPEQVDARPGIGPAADLYALGHIAYTLLVGEPYWQRELWSTPALARFFAAVRAGVREAPSARAKGRAVTLSTAFDAWFLKATALEPERRHEGALEAIRALSEAMADAVAAATPPAPPLPPPVAPPIPLLAIERHATEDRRFIIGPYRLIEEIAAGHGVVTWLAEEVYEDRKLRDVVLKVFSLPEEMAASPAEAARWFDEILDEARALCRVEHPNVVRFYGLFQDHARGVVALAMEHPSGKGLDVVLHEQGRLDERSVIEAGIDVASALAAVHDAGLVHRDVKPGSVVQSAFGYKLIDFAVAAAAAGPSMATARTMPVDTGEHAEGSEAASLRGTPGYIAPECLSLGAPASPLTDLYALGVTLFKLLAGDLPPAPAPRLDAIVPASTPATTALADVVDLLLEADPSARPRHAVWVAQELDRARSLIVTGEQRPARGSPAAGAPRGRSTRATVDSILAAADPLAPIAPLFAEVERASDRGAAIGEVGRAIGELVLGALRYAFAVGLAILAAAIEQGAPRQGMRALSEQIQSAARATSSSWCYLVRSLAEALSVIAPDAGRCLAFARVETINARLGALLRDTPSVDALREGGAWAASILESVRELSGLARDVPLSPWLPVRGGRTILPEAPRAPGEPWRAGDPLTGERAEDPLLDAAIRRLGGQAEEAAREIQERPALRGRAATLALIERAAREADQGGVRVVVLTGPQGIGRTRVLEAAIEGEDLDPDRVIWVRASPERRSPLRPLLRAVADRDRAEGSALRPLREAIERAIESDAPPSARRAGDEAIERIEEALLRASAGARLVLAIDDLQWIDPPTLDLLRLLIERTEGGAGFHLLVIAAARNEPDPSPALRALLAAVKGRVRQGVKHAALGPLSDDDAAALLQSMAPIAPDLERAVVRGAGGVPFFLVHALLVYRESGAIALRGGVWHAVDDRVLREDVPGVAELVEARLAATFDPASEAGRAALRSLAAIALYGGGLGIEVLIRVVGGDPEIVEEAMEALVAAGIITAIGDGPEHGFAQEMVRRAALNLARRRPWYPRLHRALLDAIAEGLGGKPDAAFLASGYEKLGARDAAREWLGRAMAEALAAGLFAEAAELGDRRAALSASAEARMDADLEVARALIRGRKIEEARQRLARIETRGEAVPRSLDLRRRICRLEAARGLRETGVSDPRLIADADAHGDAILRCEARMALAGVTTGDRALELAGEAVALAEGLGPLVEYAARTLRIELNYAANRRDLRLQEEDLRRALEIASATDATWLSINIQGDLAVLEAELGEMDRAIARMRELMLEAENRGMRWQTRVFLQNLAVFLHRAGLFTDAAEMAQKAAELSLEVGDPACRASALSLRGDALRRVGDLPAALASVDEAERLQLARRDRTRALSLLRRAQILAAMDRAEEGLAAARAAQAVAEEHADQDLVIGAVVWAALQRARRGEASREALEEALARARAANVTLRALTRGVVAEAEAFLTSSAEAGAEAAGPACSGRG